ncbi:MAG: hypothetical protein ACOY5U_02450 [Pseudomonadota bacterium]
MSETMISLGDRRPIRQRLSDYYTEAEIEIWLHRPHPQLDGRSPAGAVAGGLAEAVHRIIDLLDEGAYL